MKIEVEHVWITTWLTDELEGYKCGNCGMECLEPQDVSNVCITKKISKKKKKTIIMESRYTGNLDFPSWKKWHKCGTYGTPKSAQMALEAKNRLHSGSFEYRIKPDEKMTDDER